MILKRFSIFTLILFLGVFWVSCNKEEADKDKDTGHKDNNIESGCIENKEICNSWEICNETTGECELKSGKCNLDEDCLTGDCIEGYCRKDNIIFTTIQNIQTDDSLLGKIVNVEGAVTAIALSQRRTPKGLYIQNGRGKNSGLFVYFTQAVQTDIKPGYKVSVQGILDREKGALRLRTDESKILKVKSNIEYAPVKVDYFKSLPEYESMLVNIILNKRYNLMDIKPFHFVFSDMNESEILVKDTLSYLNHLSLYVKLQHLSGILENYNGSPRVLPRDENDIIVSKSVCEPKCEEWEACLDNNMCILQKGRCYLKNDCEENFICNENHYCEADESLYNSGLEIWGNGFPDGYLSGKALKVYLEDGKVFEGDYSAKIEMIYSLKESNSDVEFLSPPFSVDKEKNYLLKLQILENNYEIDAKIYYKAYDVYGDVIGSGIAGGNDFTLNVDNWVELGYTTSFVSEIWGGPIENLSYIRFGIRLYKGHCEIDETCPSGYTPTGNGYLYVDAFKIEEVR